MMKLAVAALAAGITFAHLPDRPDLNAWTMGLKADNGVPCCDGSEAVPLRDPDWRVDKEGHYKAFIEGEWVDVPDDAIVKGPNKYGQVLIWYIHTPGYSTFVRCFLPAAGA